MNWKGKLDRPADRPVAGRLLASAILLLIGIAIGHLVDIGVFSGRPSAPPRTAGRPERSYATLGITSSASDEEVDQAYRRPSRSTIPIASPMLPRRSASSPDCVRASSMAPTN
jgi:hypothetical protein